MTNEELDNAREIEAIRIYDFEQGDPKAHGLARIAARLAREGWMPPEPVDPDLLELETLWLKYTDGKINSLSDTVLAGIKRGRALAAAEAKPGMVWKKYKGCAKPPVSSKTYVCVRYCNMDEYDAGTAEQFDWFPVTHYAVITPPEDVA